MTDGDPKNFPCSGFMPSDFVQGIGYSVKMGLIELCQKLIDKGKHTRWGGAVAGAIEDLVHTGDNMLRSFFKTEGVFDAWIREAELQVTAKCP